MTFTIKTHKNKSLSIIFVTLLGLAALLGLQACGGGSSSPATPSDQDPSGLYKSGTGTLDGNSVNDIIAFVHDDRIMAFSVSAHLLIDGTIDSVTSDDYTATVNIYKDGVLSQSGISVTGMVTNGSSINGTLNGTGTGAGDFSVTFDPLYTRGATFARIDTASTFGFAGPTLMSIPGMETNNFEFVSATNYDLSSFIVSPVTRCGAAGSYTMPDSTINIYVLNQTMRQIDATCTMSETPNYTGFAAVVDGTSTDDTLLYAVSNGANSVFAVLTK